MAPLAVCPLAEYCRYPRHQLGPGRHPALVVFVFLLPAEVASSEAAAQLRELSEGSSLNNKQIFSVVQDNETFRQSYLLVIPTPDGDVPILGAKGLKVKFNKYFLPNLQIFLPLVIWPNMQCTWYGTMLGCAVPHLRDTTPALSQLLARWVMADTCQSVL